MSLDFEETAFAASSSSNPVLEKSDGDKDAGLSSDFDLQVDATPPPTKRKKYAYILSVKFRISPELLATRF